MRDIAVRAGVATGAVYQFFRSKRGLLLAAMDALLQHLESASAPAFANPALVAGDLERFLEEVFAREAPFSGVYRAWREASLTDDSIARKDAAIRVWTSARIGALFTRLSGLPGARAGVDLPLSAELWDRFFWDLLGHPPPDPPRAARSLAATLYHALFADTLSARRVSKRRPRRRARGPRPVRPSR